VIDNTGRVVWYHRFPNGPGLNFQPQPNGRYAARPPVAAGETASWVEIGVAGDVTRMLGCAHGYPPRMHDMIAEPDGSYWLLCDETRTMDLSAQGESSRARVLGTNVQHRGATGDSLFEWSPFDHFEVDVSILQTADRITPVINWTHGNALDVDGDGNLLVSFRNLSEVTKIDTRTGAVVWRMGGEHNELTFDNVGAPAFVGQHGLRVTGAGQLTLLDNLGEPLGSRAERYAVDDTRRVAHMSDSFAAPAGLIARIGGSTQSRPGGHTLVSFGNGNAVQEYDALGNVVWRIVGNSGYIFRAQRIRSLYQPGVGDPR
ncbi:MAG TPA: arylsulfotransferase family protein, partial [Gemmatimonadaceae bacterium]